MGSLRDRHSTSRVTVRSIADHTGLSIAAVSSVLNHREVERRIAEDTVKKVRRAATQLGYLPNLGARRLRRGDSVRDSLVLALITSFEAPIPLVKHFIFALRQAVVKSALPQAANNVSVMLEMFTAGELAVMPGILTGDHFNAALVLNTTPADDEFLSARKLPYPVVLVNRRIPGYWSVMEDAASGARPAEILVRRRRQDLGILYGSPLTQITRQRRDAFVSRGQSLLGRAPREIVADSLSETAGYEAMRQFLKKEKPVAALYSVSDALALGAYRALKEQGWKIPRDTAIVGVGDYEIAPYFDPPLSCVGASHQNLAEMAARLLLLQIRRGSAGAKTTRVVLQEDLRQSTGD